MTQPIMIADADDPRLDDYRRLKLPDRRMLEERSGGFFIAEGSIVVQRALDAGLGSSVRSVLAIPAQYDILASSLANIVAPTYIVTPNLLQGVVGFDLHRGVVAAIHRPTTRNASEILADVGIRTVVALENINDFENLGSIFRSATALGADAVLLGPQCCDPLYRRCVRVSMGNVLTLPYAVTESWPEAIVTMQTAGFRVLAFTPSGTTSFKSLTRQPNDRVVIALGAEGPGLTAATLASADDRVTIPMHNAADSLNVSVTAAIALHHLI